LGENIVTQLGKNSSNICNFSIAMDESLGSCSTLQLFVFIRGVDEDMNIIQELDFQNSMYGRATGEDVFNGLINKTCCDYWSLKFSHC
jgi:hypothetical protein